MPARTSRYVALSVVGLVVTAASGGLVAATTAAAGEAEARFRQSDAVVRAAENLRAVATEAETGQRGWLLTGVETFLRPYHDGTAELDAAAARLRDAAAARGDPEQVARAERAAILTRRMRSDLAFTVKQAEEGRKLYAIAHVRDGDGREVMDQIRLEVAAVKAAETVRLDEQSALARRLSRAANATAYFGFTTQFFAFGLIVALSRSRRPTPTAAPGATPEPTAATA